MADIYAIRRRTEDAMLTGEWEEEAAADREALLKALDAAEAKNEAMLEIEAALGGTDG